MDFFLDMPYCLALHRFILVVVRMLCLARPGNIGLCLLPLGVYSLICFGFNVTVAWMSFFPIKEVRPIYSEEEVRLMFGFTRTLTRIVRFRLLTHLVKLH